ncbi:hypothetical protein [Egicoccus halophilus]|uniref:Uncharacterized protein n=1 Tax=Egicoccus halophilus TaxID=1670830 RepID=A0A8J3A7G0_9ACTN|nr:hypothetical protein [Egicoccus halophilus]GGI05420.1 hypothetical protein GCM10011354_14010 [Egicoccus halophilus]
MAETADVRVAAPFTVELLALPGAGKTTVAAGVVAATDWSDVAGLLDRERRRPRRRRRHRLAVAVLPAALRRRLLAAGGPDAKDAGTFVLAHRRHADAVLDAGERLTDSAAQKLAVELLFESWSERAYVQRVGAPGDRVVLHEAVLQRLLFLLALLPAGDPAADRLLATCPLPDAVVHLGLPLSVAVERVHRRNKEFTDVAVMPAMDAALARLLTHLATAGVPLVTAAADAPVTAVVEEVSSALRVMTAGRSRP